MTKLNYINRKSEGVKLGQIVAKDLRKRIRQSTPPKNETHKENQVDLLLDGKNLTDDGLSEMVRGLEDALQASETNQRTKLRVLNLRGNGLTARSLSELAPSLSAAANDLEELDLSGNRIEVTSEEDVRNWQTFLESLGCVSTMTSINLSGNDISGIKAMEVFWKVYSQQFNDNEEALEVLADEIDDPARDGFSLPERLHSFSLQSSSESTGTDEQSTSGIHASSSFDSSNQATTAQLKGLPSVPTINLAEVGLTDFGALFLSYPLVQHRYIHDHIISHRRGSSPVKQGLIYQPNESLGTIGIKLLKFAEAVIYEPPSSMPPAPENSPMDRNVEIGPPRRASHQMQHRRNSSIGSTGEMKGRSPNPHQSSSAADDLDSLRKKLQRTILEDEGSRSVEIWSVALRLLSYARRIMSEDNRLPVPRSQAMSPINSEGNCSELRTDCLSQGSADEQAATSTSAPLHAPSPQASYASKLLFNTEQSGPVLSVLGTSNHSETPQIFRHPRNRRRSFSYHSNSSSPGNMIVGEARAVLKAAIRVKNEAPKLIGPLPARAWTIILVELADPNSVLSKRQFQSVFNWARDKQTLAFEMEALGKPESVQIWRVLDKMGCLEYDGRN